MLFISKMPINDKRVIVIAYEVCKCSRLSVFFDVGDMSAPKFHTDNDLYQFMFIPAVFIGKWRAAIKAHATSRVVLGCLVN